MIRLNIDKYITETRAVSKNNFTVTHFGDVSQKNNPEYVSHGHKIMRKCHDVTSKYDSVMNWDRFYFNY